MKTLLKNIGLQKFSLFGTNRLVFESPPEGYEGPSESNEPDIAALKKELADRANQASYEGKIDTNSVEDMRKHLFLIQARFETKDGSNGKAALRRMMEVLNILITEAEKAETEDISDVLKELLGDDIEIDSEVEDISSGTVAKTKEALGKEKKEYFDGHEKVYVVAEGADKGKEYTLIEEDGEYRIVFEEDEKELYSPFDTEEERKEFLDKKGAVPYFEYYELDKKKVDQGSLEIELEEGNVLVQNVKAIMEEIRGKINVLGEILDEDKGAYEENLETYKKLMAEIYGLFIRVDDSFKEFPVHLTQDETQTINNLKTEKSKLQEEFNNLLDRAAFTGMVDQLKQINPKLEEKKDAQNKKLEVQPGIKMISLSLKDVEGNLEEAKVATDNLEKSLEKYKDDIVISAKELLNFHLKLVDEISEIKGELAYLKAKQELGSTKVKVGKERKEVDIVTQIDLFSAQLTISLDQKKFVEDEMKKLGGRVSTLVSNQENSTNIDTPKGPIKKLIDRLYKIWFDKEYIKDWLSKIVKKKN